jgi:outer membrane lipoprotein-sorting protein
VLKTRSPDVVLTAPLDQLLKQVNERYDATKSMVLFVEMSSSTGGSMQGKVNDSIAFSGNIIVGNPNHIRVLLQVPLLGSRALDMVSDGKTFTMLYPPHDCAIKGSDTSLPTQKGLYSLRPAVILDSLLIHGLQDDQIVSMTQDSRVVENPKKRNDLILEPDYDIEFLSRPQGLVAHTLHVIHISSADLLPWRQDIYNADGKIATQAFYSNYQKFGDITFPTKIVIQRPLDALGMTITIRKGTKFNVKLDPDQFDLPIPASYQVTDMDDPASAATTPCAAHAPQSPH